MKCEDFIAQVEEIAIRDPEVRLTPELEEHLDCSHCRERYREFIEAWLLLARGLNAEPVRRELEDGVMRRVISAGRRSRNAKPMTFNVRSYALAACTLLVLTLGTFAITAWFGGDRRSARDLARVRELARQIGKIEELEQAFSDPRIKFVSLTSSSTQNRAGGYLVFDVLSGEAHFFGYNLPTATQPLTLLLRDADGNMITAQQIDTTPDGLGASLVRVPSDAAAVEEVVVTLGTLDPPGQVLDSQIVLRATVDP